MEIKITRRSFIGFIMISGFISTVVKKLRPTPQDKKAMFWRKKDDA